MTQQAPHPVRARIDANVSNYYRVPAKACIERCDPLMLVSLDRLDLVVRDIFVRQRELGWALGWGTGVSRHLIAEVRPREPVGDRVRRSVHASYGEWRAYMPQLPAKIAEPLRHTLPLPLFRGARYVDRTVYFAIRPVRGRM
jgi:hypothetical protein